MLHQRRNDSPEEISWQADPGNVVIDTNVENLVLEFNRIGDLGNGPAVRVSSSRHPSFAQRVNNRELLPTWTADAWI